MDPHMPAAKFEFIHASLWANTLIRAPCVEASLSFSAKPS